MSYEFESGFQSFSAQGSETSRGHHHQHHVMDNHRPDRPYKCSVPGCTSDGFARSEHLKRHERSVHKQSSLVYYCPIPDCPRSSSSNGKPPFFRQDHLQQHFRYKHKELSPGNVPSLEGESNNETAGELDVSTADFNEATTPAGQADLSVLSSSTRKRRRVSGRAEGSTSMGGGEVYRLREENEELRREMKELERKLEVSTKTVHSLLEVIGKLQG